LLQRSIDQLRRPANLSVDAVLYNAKVYTGKALVAAGIAIDGAKIVKIAKKTNLPTANTRIDLKGNLLLPGLVDSHVHLRGQQLAYREDFKTGTSAAAAGGVTTVVDMPNNRPLTMSVETLKDRMKTAERDILVNVAFLSAFPASQLEIRRIVHAGAVGFKLYLQQQLGGVNIDDDNALAETFQATGRSQVPIAVHAEDKATIETAKRQMLEQGRRDLEAFLAAHPPEVEQKAIVRVAELARASAARAHVCHVSSTLGLKAVLDARAAGCRLTCEVTPHHLLLNEKHLRKIGNLALALPPLRTSKDVASLWHALRRGQIDTIGSDHAPHSLEEKHPVSIWDAKLGIVGLETMLPLLLTEMNRGRLTIEQLVRLTCERPAEIFQLHERGRLDEGCFADIVVVDHRKEHRVDASGFFSKAKFSPFNGWRVKGKAVKTFVDGQLIMDEGEIVAESGIGQVIKWMQNGQHCRESDLL